MKISRLEDLAIFVSTADAGSFSAAARRMHLAPAVASAAVKRLEESLNVRLFERSTRRLRLSEAGDRYLPHARAALESLDQGESALNSDGTQFRGPLRVAMPSDLARGHLIDWFETYLRDQPKVQLELHVSDGVADLYQRPIDLAIRYGKPDDSRLIALPLAPDNRRVLCAAPSYLARCGEPRSLAELAEHNCLRFMLAGAIYNHWRFDEPGGLQQVHVQGNRLSDDADIVRRWAVAGVGIAYKSQLDVADDLRAGRLKRLLPQVRGEPAPLMLLVINRTRLTAAVRQLAAGLAAHFGTAAAVAIP
jgi:DNA-binding transcriptional LysR family regulator